MSGQGFDIIACGDDALRILCGAGPVRHAIADMLRALPEWYEVVPGKRDVTVSFDPHKERMEAAQARLSNTLADITKVGAITGAGHVLTAEFGGAAGPDLAELAGSNRKTPAEIIRMIEASLLTVDLLGFTPGFAYLIGLDAALRAERLTHPRMRVPAGSIGLITGQVGLYALEGPGGWPIVGRVMTPLFDKSRVDPFCLQPGDRVTLRGPGAR
ncbi:MAG: 5-oxoprolinase subunit B family protein [Hyphomonas sp.]